jgi:hypothetical protein
LSASQRFANAFLYRGDPLARNHTADNSVRELELCTTSQRLDLHEHNAILAVAASLAHVPPLRFRVRRDRLPIGNVRRRHVDGNPELSVHALCRDRDV